MICPNCHAETKPSVTVAMESKDFCPECCDWVDANTQPVTKGIDSDDLGFETVSVQLYQMRLEEVVALRAELKKYKDLNTCLETFNQKLLLEVKLLKEALGEPEYLGAHPGTPPPPPSQW